MQLCGAPAFTVSCKEGNREDLRACTYVQEDGCVYLFFNEHPYQTVKAEVAFTDDGISTLVRYDAVSNRAAAVTLKEGKLYLELYAGEAAAFIRTEGEAVAENGYCDDIFPKIPGKEEDSSSQTLDGPWEIALREDGIDTTFKTVRTNVMGSSLKSINGPDAYPHFSGTIRYTADFEIEEIFDLDRNCVIDLPGIHDGTAVRINGCEAGILLGVPYRVAAGAFLKKGRNTIEIETVNTLTWRVHDGQSTHMQMNPTGMVKAPVLYGMRRRG